MIDPLQQSETHLPAKIEAQLLSAQALFLIGDYDGAFNLLHHLAYQDPNNSSILRALGTVAQRRNQPAQAFRYYRQAVAANPQDADAHMALGMLYLLHGNYEFGFLEYEWRLLRDRCVVQRYTDNATFWKGEELTDQVLLLHCEQGFGDALQFIRYLPLVAQRVKKIYLACHPELCRLFNGFEELLGLISDKQPLPAFDFHCPLLSLPRLLGGDGKLSSIPVPYLPRRHQARTQNSKIKRIGLVWRANRQSPNGSERSVPLSDLHPILNLPFSWTSLQKEIDPKERELIVQQINLEESGTGFQDFEDTANCLKQLDLVISVDTSVVHLAAALGIRTWLLGSKWADWRWLVNRSDSPWYPTLKIFRQSVDRDWTEPIERIRQELQAHL